MGLFSKSKQWLELLSPMTGKVIPVEQCPDAVFAGKVLGDGVAVIPTDGRVYAPVDGKVVQVAHSLHAFCIVSDDGLEVLIHLGMDTVKLDGKGFPCHIAVGQQVHRGELVMEMDLPFIMDQGIPTVSPCIITNLEMIHNLKPLPGNATGGKTTVLTYQLS